MTDHIPNDLSHLSDAEFNALCPQGEHAPGPQPLSPAAQAVLDAACESLDQRGYISDQVAAALRAVAERNEYKPDMRDEMEVMFSEGWNSHRKELLAIADELGGHA
jgi:hypothetical protein